jgi:peptide/nickel transport system substrate-binding protein
MATIDDAAREKLLQEASKLAMSDYGIIPLHFECRPPSEEGFSYKPRQTVPRWADGDPASGSYTLSR